MAHHLSTGPVPDQGRETRLHVYDREYFMFFDYVSLWLFAGFNENVKYIALLENIAPPLTNKIYSGLYRNTCDGSLPAQKQFILL